MGGSGPASCFFQMAGCQSSGKSVIVYVKFREKCLGTGVGEEERVSTGHET